MAKRRTRTTTSQRKATAKKYGFTVPDWNPFSAESEVAYYRKLARRADDRLRKLEAVAMEDRSGFKDILKYAYRTAMYEIRNIRGKEWSRFSQGIPKTKSGDINRMELHRRTEAVKRFLEAPSSTVSGVKRVYMQKAESLNNSLGLTGSDRLTWQDISNYYESKFAEKEDSKYGSKTKFRALGAIRRVANDPEKIKQAVEGNLKLAKDETVNQVAVEMLKNGLDPASIF